MLKRWMHNRERYFAMRDDDRVVHPFAWGMEFVDANANGVDPRKFFREYSARTLEHSDEFFFSPEISDFRLVISDQARSLIWTSGINTPSVENNTVRAR